MEYDIVVKIVLDHLGTIYVYWYGKIGMYILSEKNKLQNNLIPWVGVYVYIQTYTYSDINIHTYPYIYLVNFWKDILLAVWIYSEHVS